MNFIMLLILLIERIMNNFSTLITKNATHISHFYVKCHKLDK